ncbi:MAG: adenine phosphoribosyltransferase [archaeon]
MDHIKEKIRTVPHWPKKGVMFRDITTLLLDAQGIKDIVAEFKNRYKDIKVDKVAAIEARGFIIGALLAHELGVGFIPIRKKGKLPAETTSMEYDLEYGKDTIEIHTDAITKGDKIVLADDLIATGGTCLAACNLIEKLGGEIVECAFVIDLPELGGKEKLAPRKVFSLVEFDGE